MKKIICLLLSLLLLTSMLTSCDIGKHIEGIENLVADVLGKDTESTTESATESIPTEPEATTPEAEVTTPEAEVTPPEVAINYGTVFDPVSVTYAYSVCANYTLDEISANGFYVIGTVTKVVEATRNAYFTDGRTELRIYFPVYVDFSDLQVGETILVNGHIMNYQGTIEMVGRTIIKQNTTPGDPTFLFTDFTSEEKALFADYFGFVIPFISNNKYFVEEYEFEDEVGINFYTYENTQAEFDAYRSLFSVYTSEGSDIDDYGDTWYFYSKGDVYIDMSRYVDDHGVYVVDIYVYTVAGNNSGNEGDGETDPDTSEINYGTLNSPVSTTYAHTVCANLANNESSAKPFYIKGKVTEIGQTGNYYKNVYFTDGTTEMLIYTINMGEGITGFEVGDTIVAYGYVKNYNGIIEMATYNGSVYVYVVRVESENGNQGGSDTNSNVITNDGKGLPKNDDGIYDLDFTKGNYVQNVTDQGYYLDGCPTTGSPAVLVIPVEFSDATAQSKGYSIANIERIFCGTDLSYYSVHDYFFISSYQKLDLDITVVDAWFRPKNNSSYYENATYDYYGEKIEIGDQLILDEALAYLSTIMDLSEFDSDNNGIIDAVVMVNTLDIGDDNFHWAYRYWNVYTDEEDYYFEYDGVSANDYMWASCEFMFENYDENGDANYDRTNPLNPYTFIHEFSHVLGADDYYDTEYEEHPLGGFDMMDSMSGDHNPYTKFNYGWITTSKLIVTDKSVTVTLDAFEKNGDTIIISNNWDDSLGAYQEYYVIVYYKNTGLNAGEGGFFARDGVLVYHVNASLFAEEYDGETYYDVYNTNTSANSEYGTEDNLIEFVLSIEGNYTYIAGDKLPTVTDDSGNTLSYTFVIDSITADSATITFTKK